MVVKLAYGKEGLNVRLPDNLKVTIIEPKYVPGLVDPESSLKKSLRAPYASGSLKEMSKGAKNIGLVVNDISRATPYKLILPVIFDELGNRNDTIITIFVALGTHRQNTENELRTMLGDDVVNKYRIIQNRCKDKSTQVRLGVSSYKNEVWINREFSECDLKILTGFIEPHFFAGFSGGGKAVMPGMAGLDTILNNHSVKMIDHPMSAWGETAGNPIWEEICEAALMAGTCFLVNVTLNKDKEITGIFTGDLTHVHAHGTAFAKKVSMVPVDHSFDIVITSNSGYPLDLNLYQAVKGMSAAARIVRKGGAIIITADCWDGIPDHGLYGKLLKESQNPEELLKKIQRSNVSKQDQWQAQIQAKIQLHAEVYVQSHNLTSEQIESALLKTSKSVEQTVQELISRNGTDSRICILPEGPQTIPYIDNQ